MYTEAIERPRALRPRHSVENQWDLLAALGIAPPERRSIPVEMAESRRCAASEWTLAGSRGLPLDAPLVVLHVSAGNPFRRWPLEHFAEAAAALVAATLAGTSC